MPLVVKNELLIAVEVKDRVREVRLVFLHRQQRESPAHPQMNDQRLCVIEIDQDVLAATSNRVDPGRC